MFKQMRSNNGLDHDDRQDAQFLFPSNFVHPVSRMNSFDRKSLHALQ